MIKTLLVVALVVLMTGTVVAMIVYLDRTVRRLRSRNKQLEGDVRYWSRRDRPHRR